jgi:hypothetical protein
LAAPTKRHAAQVASQATGSTAEPAPVLRARVNMICPLSPSSKAGDMVRLSSGHPWDCVVTEMSFNLKFLPVV